ncbi:MAG: histidine phosphatase family protein [Myxococcales bacterium]|nr:histidine phosphatase family protein [Myxococcales bacterium]
MAEETPIWFVRHGQSTANASGVLAGHQDADLTELGITQARAVRARLSELSPDRVVSSDLRRAWRTAALAWPVDSPSLERTPLLRERDLGEWEGQAMAPLRASGAANRLLTWHGAPPGGESQAMLARRVIGWLAEQDDGRSALLFVHGGLIRSVVGLLDGTPLDQIGSWRVRNTEVVPRRVPRGRWAELLDEPSYWASSAMPG